MAGVEQIRILRVEGKAVGMETVTSALNKVSDAADRVTMANDGVSASTTRTESKSLSMAKALETVQRRLDAEYRAQQDVAKMQRTLDIARDQGLTSIDRYNQLTSLNSARLNDNAAATDRVTQQMGLARHELINLGRQAQDVGTMLAMGASVSQVVTSQAAQVVDIFSSSQGTVKGFYEQVRGYLGGFLTAGRVAFGGVAVAITGAGLALNSYLTEQNKIQMSLLGAGRASGASLGDINTVAKTSSSLTGFSVSEARAFASELASVGKIGRDNLAPLVKIGHDIATVYGIEAADAAKMLAKAFADPVAGADQLNQRLGFLDAATQRNIANLVVQNRLQDAQRVLQAGVASSLSDVSQAVATSTKFWTALGNVASNTWDRIGEAASRATGIGLTRGLEEQIDNSRKRVAELEQIASRRSDAANKALGTADLLTREKAKLDDLTASYSRYGQAAVEAQQRAFSFSQAQGVRGKLPEIEQQERLRNENELLVRTMVDVQTTGGATSPILQRMGVSYDDLARAVASSSSKLKNFRTDFEQASQAQALQMQSLTAFSPSAKGQIAFQERFNAEIARGTVETKAAALAAGDQAIAVKGIAVAMSEAARQRSLSAQQAVNGAQLEIDMIGKTIGQQAELRANLQARQQLEQQASQNRTAFDDAEYARLQKINAEFGRRTQLAAHAAINDNVKFGGQTALLSPDDVSVAQQLRGVYGDVAASLNSVEAAGLRANMALSSISGSVSNSLTSGLADIADGTKSVSQGFSDMSKTIIRALEEALIKMMIVAPLMRAMNSVMMGGISGFSGGGIVGGGSGLSLTGTGGLYADGGYTGPGARMQPAGVVHRGEVVWSQRDVARAGGVGVVEGMRLGMRGYDDGGAVDIAPASLRSRSAAPSSATGALSSLSGGNVVVNVNNAPAGSTAEVHQRQDENGNTTIEVSLRKMVETVGVESIANGDMGRAMESKYGLKKFAGA
jgi:phage-related minor tail protein